MKTELAEQLAKVFGWRFGRYGIYNDERRNSGRREDMKFRKKPVVIEAFQMTAEHRETNVDWPEWLSAAWNKPFEEAGSFYCVAGSLMISTLEGAHVVSTNDWIIQGVKGELYPCKPDIFEATYEPVAAGGE